MSIGTAFSSDECPHCNMNDCICDDERLHQPNGVPRFVYDELRKSHDEVVQALERLMNEADLYDRDFPWVAKVLARAKEIT